MARDPVAARDVEPQRVVVAGDGAVDRHRPRGCHRDDMREPGRRGEGERIEIAAEDRVGVHQRRFAPPLPPLPPAPPPAPPPPPPPGVRGPRLAGACVRGRPSDVRPGRPPSPSFPRPVPVVGLAFAALARARFGAAAEARGSTLARAAPPPLAAVFLADTLGMRLGALLFLGLGRRDLLVHRHHVAEHLVEAQLLQAFGEMRRQLRLYVDLAAIGVIDADPPCVEVHLAADAPGQERRPRRHICRRRRLGGRSPPCGRATGGCGR